MARQTSAELEEEERAAWRDRAEAEQEMAEASAEAWTGALGTQGRTAEDPTWPAWRTNSSPPSPAQEHRSKSVHDPFCRAEADARAAADVAGCGEMGDHEPKADQTITTESPPAVDPADETEHGDEGDRRRPRRPVEGCSRRARRPHPGLLAPWLSPGHKPPGALSRGRLEAGLAPGPRLRCSGPGRVPARP